MNTESQNPNDSRPFRICEKCGLLTPSDSPNCVNCDAVSMQTVAEAHQAKAERHFVNALFSRATPVTYAILGLNILIYVSMTAVSGGKFMETFISMNDHGALVAFGAKTNELLRQGEWFRFVTPIFIHGGLLHLASNSYAFWTIGPLVEKLYGSARFLLIYLLAGIGGVIGSYIGGLARPAWVPGVGASGAIFGLFGLLAVFGYKYRHELPPDFRKAIKSSILPVIVINLIIGYSIPFIDNGAHLGGLFTGALLGLAIPYLAPGAARVSPIGLAILAACVLIVVFSFVRAYQKSGPYLAQRSEQVQNFLDQISNADEVMVKAINREGGAQTELALRLTQSAQGLESGIAPDERAEKLRQTFLGMVQELQKLYQQPNIESRSDSLNPAAEKLLQAREEYKNWIKSNGERYGYQLRGDNK